MPLLASSFTPSTISYLSSLWFMSSMKWSPIACCSCDEVVPVAVPYRSCLLILLNETDGT
uniref:Uncharacterized protein MANES_12G099700 n=1 Tax=Rhizophora mucronata TaxID=61149 RepID=A0A2P2LJI4_RHIMU